MKRMLSLLMALAMLVCLLPSGKMLAAPEGESHQTQIDRMNALLNGLILSDQYTQNDVAHWSDEAVADAIYRKLIWDYQFSDHEYTEKLRADSEKYYAYKLSGLNELSRSCYGRSFPQDAISHGLEVKGDTVYVDVAAGESTTLSVQDFDTLGDRVIAVGVAVYFGGPLSNHEGYFQAEFRKNENSIYGLTLVSLKEIQGNQDLSNLVADASTELEETTVTHYAQRVLDGKLDTAWCEGVKGVGVGQWIRISNGAEKKLEIIAIEIHAGYQADQRRLDNNGCPTEFLIECEGGYSQKAMLYDYDAVVLLDTPVKTDWVKLTILDAMPGEKYEDTCISEIRLLGLDMGKIIAQQPPVETKPQETQPEITTPQATQPEKTQPANTQPTAPQKPSGDGEADGGKGETKNSGVWLTVIVAAAALAVGIVIGLLLRSRKKKTAAPQYSVYGNPWMQPTYQPQGDPQSWQNAPNTTQPMPQNPKGYPQRPQPNFGPDAPQNPGQQEQ